MNQQDYKVAEEWQATANSQSEDSRIHLDEPIAVVGCLSSKVAGLAERVEYYCACLSRDNLFAGKLSLYSSLGVPEECIRLNAIARHTKTLHVISDDCGSFHTRLMPFILYARLLGLSIHVTLVTLELERELGRWLRPLQTITRFIDSFTVTSCYQKHLCQDYGIDAEVFSLPHKTIARFQPTNQPIQPKALVVEERFGDGNIPSALRALTLVKQKYPRAELVIALASANPSHIELCRSLCCAPGVTVVAVSSDLDLQRVMSTCDVYLNASATSVRQEFVLWALSQGLPVISTSSFGMNELLIHNETGLLCEPFDHSAIANHLIDLVEQTEQSQRLRARGPLNAAKFSWAALKRQWRAKFAPQEPAAELAV